MRRLTSPSVHKKLILQERARCMRHVPAAGESLLWSALRARRLGVCFRRQAVVYGAIVDFLAVEARLIVELDGLSHVGRERADQRRDERLATAGYRTLRIDVALVRRDLAAAAELVRAALRDPP